jgi:hypothetical protein
MMNMDTVTMKPYSPSGSNPPAKATILIKANIASIFSRFTQFNIISSTTLKPEIYELSENVTETDRNAVISPNGWTLVVIRSNLSLYNLTIISKQS